VSDSTFPYRDLARLAEAASRLLLNSPNEVTLAALEKSSGGVLDLERSRQDFYDHLCIVQSGCFVPPVAHVLRQARQTEAYWHFGTPRYDGGDALALWYDASGFEPSELPADPFLAGANRPLDHVGVLLAFLAALLNAAHDDEADRLLIGEFLGEHIEPWADTFAQLLSCSASPYIALLGSMFVDLFDALRETIPSLMPRKQWGQPNLCDRHSMLSPRLR
jgi:hypothetical protein